MRNLGMVFSFAIALAVAAAAMPPALMNAVFLGTVGRLDAAISAAFTSGMGRAFLASALISGLAILCSSLRNRQQTALGQRLSAARASAEGSDAVQMASKR
jgi:hypothetical protein